jgi:hypothetical protein
MFGNRNQTGGKIMTTITLPGRIRPLPATAQRTKRLLAGMRKAEQRRLDAERFGLWDMDRKREAHT